jgi:RNA polymerase sigma-70 factor (ECF subfamily)
MKEDLELIDRFIAGDEEAAGELVMRYQKMVYVFAYRMTNNMEDAKDITQTSFIRAIEGIRKFKRESSFRTWLYRIVANTGLNHIRRGWYRDAEINDSLSGNQAGALSLIIEGEKKNRIKKALAELPERQRLAILLRTYEEFSCREASRVMGCSESTVKAHYHFGVKKLRELLSDRHDSPAPEHHVGKSGRKDKGI